MFMSDDNVPKNGENELPLFEVTDQQNASPRSNSVASSASSIDRSNSPDGGPIISNGIGIIEVSDKEDDEAEDEDFRLRRNHMPALRRQDLMPCGHLGPPTDPKRIKLWASHARNVCPTCNPLTTGRNLIRNNELSGWRKTMEQLIERNIFPLSVLNLNETFVYTGNNGNETTLLPATPNGPPFMMDLDLFLSIVCASDLCRLPLRALIGLRTFVHSDTRVVPFFEKIHPQSLCHFSVNLLETAIRLMEEPTEHSEIAFRRSKMALQCFYHCAVRVPFFRETIQKHQLNQWLNLLRIEFLRHDIILCTFTVIKEMHAWFFHSDDLYVRFLSDLLVLYSSPTIVNDHRAFVTNIFVILFNVDPSFLYYASRLFDREIFTELLTVLESALNVAPICRFRDYEHNIPPKSCLHSANLAFCLELLEQIDRELSECRTRYDVGIRLTMLVHIIYICASSDIYNDVLCRGNAISLICGILKALMFVQREVGVLLVRAQHFINTRQRIDLNTTPNKYRHEARMGPIGGIKGRQARIQNAPPQSDAALPRKGMEAKKPSAYNEDDEDASAEEQSPEAKQPLKDQRRTLHAARTPNSDRAPLQNLKQSPPDTVKKELTLSRDVEMAVDAQVVPFGGVAENGDEPRKKHARLNSRSEGANSSGEEEDSPLGGNQITDDDQGEPIQVDDNSADLEEIKPLLSPSDISCSSSTSGEEPNQKPAVRQSNAKNKPTPNPTKKPTEEAMDEEESDEEDSGADDSKQGTSEGIFGTRAESLFADYMAERTPDFDLSALNEDELLAGLPQFRSIQPIYQMVITRNIPPHLFTSLKQSTLRAVTYLCKESQRNKMIAGRLEAIPLILQCAMRQEGERSIMLQLALLALKALCWNCPENQERLLDIVEGCSHFIDRQQLLASMSFAVAVDEKSGKTVLVPIEKEQ